MKASKIVDYNLLFFSAGSSGSVSVIYLYRNSLCHYCHHNLICFFFQASYKLYVLDLMKKLYLLSGYNFYS